MQKSIYLELDRPGSIRFEGSRAAELFTEEIRQSVEGVLNKNFYYDEENAGFVSASVDGRPWDGTMWTRDAGVFLREMVSWGYTGRACLIAGQLIRLCAQNSRGFYTFPEKFEPGKRDCGDETDGTSAILIGFSLLARQLKLIGSDTALEFLDELMAFVRLPESPLEYLLKETGKKPLLAGTGEFGGGMSVEGEYCNVVQNMLAVNAFTGWQKAFEELHDEAGANRCKEAADRLEANIRRYLVRDGKFLWCVDPKTLMPPDDVLNTSANVGFSGINGVGAMLCDVRTNAELADWWGRDQAVSTFLGLLQSPPRKVQYQKYGMYLQFENFCEGMLTSPAYGQGYAIQLALSMGLKEEAGKLFRYLAEQTYEPHECYELHRASRYWFYERMLSPDYFELPAQRHTVGEGCGALNLVNVAEPMKIARMLAGLTEKDGPEPVFIGGISRVRVRNWPIAVQGRLTCRDFDLAQIQEDGGKPR